MPCNFYSAEEFLGDRAVVSKVVAGGKLAYGYIDRSGKEVIPCQFDMASGFRFANTWVGMEQDGEYTYTLIGPNGETVLHPSRLRLMRRMLRDRNFRHRSVAETLSMFEHVQAGEHKYIAPYKKRALFSVDTFLPYELGIYKTLLDGELEAEMQHSLLRELRQMWDDVEPLRLEQVPADSLVREFAGDSAFHY